MRDVASLTPSDFEAAVGSTFEVIDSAGQVVVALSLAHVVRRPGRPGQRQAFSVYWTGPSAPILGQFTHRLAHPEIGDVEIFLGPIANDGPGVTYEAVFG
jgi:hypothetical protein